MADDGAKIDRRQAVLLAALDLFSERGFHGTSVPLIAERAGVSMPTLYRYFDSKEALVNAVFQHCKHEVARTLVNDFPAHEATGREMFRAFWQRLTTFAAKSPAAFRFLELHHHSYLDAKSRDVADMLHAAGRVLFAETSRRGETKAIDPELLLSMVWGAFAGAVKCAADQRIVLDPRALDDAESCLWDAIRK